MDRHRHRYGFILLVSMLVVVAFCLLRRPLVFEDGESGDVSVAAVPKKITNAQSEVPKQVLTPDNVSVTSQKPLSSAEVHGIKTWDLAHGYFDSSDIQEYRSYSLETLEALGHDGDLKALSLISEHYIKNGDLDAAFRYLKLAAVYGSTEALVAYSSFSGIYFRNVKSPELKEDYAINALAFLAVAARRGDSYADLRGIADFKEKYGFYPSADQAKAIEKRASEIYSDLESSRVKLGLTEFDNTANIDAHRAYRKN